MKKHLWWSLVVAGLVASNASAVEFFVPIPNLGKSFTYRTEFSRTDLSKTDVSFTFVTEGKSGLGQPVQHFTVLPGPSTSMTHPLLTDDRGRDFRRPPDRSDPKWFLNAPGLVTMEGEPGLLGVSTGVGIGSDPTSAWALPMLTADDAYKAGSTVYVLNMTKTATVSSELSLFNLGSGNALCTAKLLSPKGNLIDTRANIAVPALGAVRIADIMKLAGVAAGLSASVTCDHPFYSLGSFPAPTIDDIRVLYPSNTPPTDGILQSLVSNVSFRVTQDNSVQTFELPLDDNVSYRSIAIDFDATVTAPSNTAYYRGVLGMWRNEPGQRFGKTLYFGVNERFDRSKLMIDLGSPYIEYLIKKNKAPLVGGRTYHFHIEVNADQELIRQVVTNGGGGVVADMRSGLFNDDLRKRNGNTLIVGFGLPGIGDGAYSPPYGWRFSKITINGFK
jgi:hypothetical protein